MRVMSRKPPAAKPKQLGRVGARGDLDQREGEHVRQVAHRGEDLVVRVGRRAARRARRTPPSSRARARRARARSRRCGVSTMRAPREEVRAWPRRTPLFSRARDRVRRHEALEVRAQLPRARRAITSCLVLPPSVTTVPAIERERHSRSTAAICAHRHREHTRSAPAHRVRDRFGGACRSRRARRRARGSCACGPTPTTCADRARARLQRQRERAADEADADDDELARCDAARRLSASPSARVERRRGSARSRFEADVTRRCSGMP